MEHATLRNGYHFLRLVESRLRIVHNRSLDELPEGPEDLGRLARRLGFEAEDGHSAADRFLARLDWNLAKTRALFLTLVARERNTPSGEPGAPPLRGPATGGPSGG